METMDFAPSTISEGRAVTNVQDWGDLDLNYKIIADIQHDCVSAVTVLRCL